MICFSLPSPFRSESVMTRLSGTIREQILWLQTGLDPFGLTVSSFVPRVFESYVRIFHVPRSVSETQGDPVSLTAAEACRLQTMSPEAFVDAVSKQSPDHAARDGSLHPLQVQEFLEVARNFTTLSSKCILGSWQGYGALRPEIREGESYNINERSYFFRVKPLDAIRTTVFEDSGPRQFPNYVWPLEQSWCMCTDIDLPWTYAGGSTAFMQALCESRLLLCSSVVSTAFR